MYFIENLVPLDDTTNDILYLVSILAILYSKLLGPLGGLLIFWLDQACLQSLVPTILEAVLDVDIRCAVHKVS